MTYTGTPALILSSHIGNDNEDMRGLITRQLSEKLTSNLESSPIAAILGPRQCGKSTLPGIYLNNKSNTMFL
ncbi:MAG: hypothetical protein KAJ98_08560, partial [Spirochaetaceae bacterium]|nr:hypothetical protein [Spirochaetaceae bacterium]